MTKQLIDKLAILMLVMAMPVAQARLLDELTDPNAAYTGPTVEERIALMDTDKNGFCDVHEIRKFLEKQHGKDYKQDLLAKLEANAVPQSCGASVADIFTEE